MTPMMKRLTNGLSEWRVVAALLAIHAALAVSSMLHTSLTWDEPSYIGIGRQFIETGNPQLKALQLHPPLAYYVNSLFLFPLKFEPTGSAMRSTFIMSTSDYRSYSNLSIHPVQ